MEKPAFTPGPWAFEKCPCGHSGCTSYVIGHQGAVGFKLPDAMLIAAAPDMYEALKAARKYVETCDAPDVLCALDAALAKAEDR
jgi:hypothetical protein